MSATIESSDVFPVVRELIADCLAIEPDEVGRESHFKDNLGGESIDVIDLNFRVEKRFGIRAPFAKLSSPEGWEFADDGRLTPECLARWRARYPELNWSLVTDQPGPQSPELLLTVDTICKLIQHAVGRQAG